MTPVAEFFASPVIHNLRLLGPGADKALGIPRCPIDGAALQVKYSYMNTVA